MSLEIAINGQSRTFDQLESSTSLAALIAELGLKGDRIAVEHNGTIAQRTNWSETSINSGDKLEIVHFVGGGMGKEAAKSSSYAASLS